MTETNRLEAFSDGVLAIAITLLILDIKVPLEVEGSLWSALGGQKWTIAAYVTSFLVLGVMWVNHHALFASIRYVDRPLLFLNLLLLMGMSAMPFTTSLFAEYLGQGGANAHVAGAVYSGLTVYLALMFGAVWGYAAYHPRLLAEGVDPAAARASVPRFSVGVVVYALTVGLAFLSPVLTLAVHAGIAIYYVTNRLAAPDRQPA